MSKRLLQSPLSLPTEIQDALWSVCYDAAEHLAADPYDVKHSPLSQQKEYDRKLLLVLHYFRINIGYDVAGRLERPPIEEHNKVTCKCH